MHVWQVIGASCTVGSLLIATGCTRVNPAYDPLDSSIADAADGGGTAGEFEDGEETLGDGSGVDDEGEDDGGSTSGVGDDGGVDDGADEPGDDSGDDEGPAVEEDEDLLLYSSLDSLQTVVTPEVGAGAGLLSEPTPELTPGAEAMALRTISGQQWFAFPQHDGQVANVDHAAGTLEMDLRVEFDAPHFEPRDLVSLAGVLSDGGGIRLGAGGLLDGNRLRVEYIDASGQAHLTRYPAGLLLADAWVHVTLQWKADVDDGEPNIELWIDDEWIEPLFGYAEGPKQAGSASPEDVMIFGSWSQGLGYSADASFDEIELRRGSW